MNYKYRKFEEVDDDELEKEQEMSTNKVLIDKDEYEKMSSHYKDSINNNKGQPKESKDGIANLLNVFSWMAFALGLIPFFPYKTAIMAAGVASGYVYKDSYGGSKSGMIANIALFALRVVFWGGLLLFLPIWAWLVVMFM